ncbi:phage tail tape measure protein [Rhodococcus sp. JVH1]|uniref:phage tail tape measure protein n=1 Tax=Rhodococcus sp. JVH1 TaxID=745408 RepID=UPI0002720D1B|nr:phage tail tape measure protein [Rhodococcus sp. JVH1]EJJ01046.1 phage tail tape measure protein, TP901 family, core region [Rhodococcus sp. JVH1]
MAGGRIDIEVGVNTRDVPNQLERGLQPAVGAASKFAGAFGLALGAAGAAAVAKQIITIGNDYTTTLNTMSAVSGATASQMAAVSARAKELGNDIELPNTSASDAAAAMTELAKGGFTVEQSMSAAKGTLQLAAAAQIDAASAATIQSQALQAFGLSADYAGKTADVLANTANASSAEMTDVAQGLQQAGAVANQFGLTIEDTAATLGVLSNAGIQGSDAGTLLKSTLLALTDTSNPAQGAIEQLGLTVYDAQGKFVGMSSLFGQLDEAAKSMTPEMYQAATATLFGSDAMRLAGIAAQQGAGGFDTMLAAVNRQGAAAEVAAAKTQGLPGAMASVQNAAETLGLKIYEVVDGPLQTFATEAAGKISGATDGIINGLQNAGEFLGPVADTVGKLASAFMELPAPVQAAAVAFAAVKTFDVDDKLSSWADTAAEKVGGLADTFKGFREEMEVQQSLAAQSSAEFDGLGESLSENAEPLGEWAAGLATLEARVPAINEMGESYRRVSGRTREWATEQRALGTATGGLRGTMRQAGASVGQFAGVVGGAALAGTRGLASAAKGLVGVMGGPWVVGIMAASWAIGQIAAKHAEAEQKARDQEAAEKALQTTLDAQTGKITAETKRKIAEDAEASGDLERIQSYGLDVRDYVKAATGDDAAYGRIATVGRENVDQGLAGQKTFNEESYAGAGINREELVSGLLKEGDSWDTLNQKIERYNAVQQSLAQAGAPYKPAIASLQELIDGMGDGNESAVTLTQNINNQKESLDRVSNAQLESNKALGEAIPVTDQLRAKFAEYGATVESVPDEKTVVVRGLTDEAKKKVEELGFSVEEMEDGSFKIVANSDEAKAVLADMIGRINLLNNEKAIPSVALDKTGFELSALQTDQILKMLDNETASPETRLIMDGIREGKQLTLADLQTISATTADPKVIIALADFLRDVTTVNTELNNAARQRTATISIETIDRANNTARAQGYSYDLDQYGREAGGRLPGFASGGRMPARTAVDDIYAVLPDGTPIAKVNGKEWVVNDEMSERYDKELAMINAGTFPKLPGFEAGGRLARDRIEDVGAQMDGVPYSLGGASFSGADCSGFVAMLQRAARGEEDPQGRLGTTYDLLAGSWPDLVPGTKGPFVVGTSEEHMAATIYGTNYESGGSYGAAKVGGSVGAFDAQFGNNQFYLPWEKFWPPITSASADDTDSAGGDISTSRSGSSKKKATWTESDEKKLESAVIAVQQAKEAQERTNANPKKTDADRDQAQNKVERAELRVQELEDKKAAAKAGKDAPPAPEAPDLSTSYTDDQLSLRQAERAVDKARLDRNEVYDDPESTQEQKDEADDQLQSAINALTEQKKGKSKGTSDSSLPSSWSELFGEIGKEFISSNVSDVLGYYGVDDMGPLAQAGIAIGQAAGKGFRDEAEQTGDSAALDHTLPLANIPITDSEAKTQLPVTPGVDGWVNDTIKALGTQVPDELMKAFRTQIPLYDTGGIWPTGTPGFNASGHDELVLTHEQRKAAGQDFALLSSLASSFAAARSAPAAPAAPQSGSPFDSLRPLTINGADRREVAAGIRMAQQEDSWRMAQIRGIPG